MPRQSTATAFSKSLAKLLTDRKKLSDKITKLQVKLATIDGLFEQFGISLEAGAAKATRGAKVAKAAKAGKGRKAGRRKRGKFEMTGEESILKFVAAKGKPTTAEINAQWFSEGRGGKADNTLTRLFKEKKLKRIEDPEVRGSRYAVA